MSAVVLIPWSTHQDSRGHLLPSMVQRRHIMRLSGRKFEVCLLQPTPDSNDYIATGVSTSEHLAARNRCRAGLIAITYEVRHKDCQQKPTESSHPV